ncbi:phosphoenolpyruvate carboxykinase (ATP) [Ancylobacter sp.]|uniref:phosphoenolpyruvate carboxykinase (ATP) n=1 Tax=Ancylobacter sp. TaxID=1872567 RepID=UPI003D0AF335
MTQSGTQNEHTGHESEGLPASGLSLTGRVFWNLGAAALCERAVARGEARLSDSGALVVTTAAPSAAPAHYVVRTSPHEDGAEEALRESTVILSRAHFEALKSDLLAHTASRTLFAQDVQVDAGSGLRLRVLSEQAWHGLFARHLFPAADVQHDAHSVPDVTILCAPGFRIDPEAHGVDATGAIAIDVESGVALVAGIAGSEAIRHALFTFLAHRLPNHGVLPLNGAATADPAGDVALFLGPPGAGKSALAGDATHVQIGDGALGWNRDGIVPLEAGVCARLRDLSHHPGAEAATRRFGAVLENVPVDTGTRAPDFAPGGSSSQARAIVPLGADRNPGAPRPPAHLFLLVHDALGVLPPIARLSSAQALYHFLSGYSAGGSAAMPETIVEAAVAAPFAPCFTPALPHAPDVYGALLRDLLARHEPSCWLVNTGWIGGRAGTGRRVPLETSRRLVDAAQAGELAAGEWRTDPHFGFSVPAALEGVDPVLLDPVKAWTHRADHAAAARRLTGLFATHFARFETTFGEDVRGAQPGMAMAAE